jgi:hypothetical protein
MDSTSIEPSPGTAQGWSLWLIGEAALAARTQARPHFQHDAPDSA